MKIFTLLAISIDPVVIPWQIISFDSKAKFLVNGKCSHFPFFINFLRFFKGGLRLCVDENNNFWIYRFRADDIESDEHDIRRFSSATQATILLFY